MQSTRTADAWTDAGSASARAAAFTRFGTVQCGRDATRVDATGPGPAGGDDGRAAPSLNGSAP